MKELIYWLAGLFAILIIVMTVTITKACTMNPPLPTPAPVIEVVDTIKVTQTIEKTIYRDKIKARVDTLYVDNPSTYIATLDTTLVMPKAEIHTRIDFKHPDQLFTFYQQAKVQADTIYVNRTRIVETTKVKQNWTAAVIGTLNRLS